MKKTAVAPANIAFIKYWGKKDEKLRLPENSSISMNLDRCFTTTTVEFDKKYSQDSFDIIGEKVTDQELTRVKKHLNRIRKKANISLYTRVVSKNSFPKSSGMAASASGFAALTLAASKAAGLNFLEKELTILARLGSGSACRSIPDGFVEWKEGNTSTESYAYSLYPRNYWNLQDILVVVSGKAKSVGSTQGQKRAKQSIFYKERVIEVQKLIPLIKQALAARNFPIFGEIVEKDCLYMHSVMMTSDPALFYWLPKTIEIIRNVYRWREEGIPVYFTIDAGPNVHLICESKDEGKVMKEVKKMTDLQDIIINKPAKGAHLISKHLF